MKEIKEATIREIYHHTGLEEYHENEYTTQSIIQIQCNAYQTTSDILYRIKITDFTICMETQKTPNSQSNLKKEKWNRNNQALQIQTVLVKTVWYWQQKQI